MFLIVAWRISAPAGGLSAWKQLPLALERLSFPCSRRALSLALGAWSRPGDQTKDEEPRTEDSRYIDLKSALIVTASHTENDMSYGSGAEARL